MLLLLILVLYQKDLAHVKFLICSSALNPHTDHVQLRAIRNLLRVTQPEVEMGFETTMSYCTP